MDQVRDQFTSRIELKKARKKKAKPLFGLLT